ncbi:hypothetical protein AABC07_15955 [Streptomyces sp. LNU-CPARS28]
MLDLLLTALKDRGLVKAGGRQRTDSTRVLAAVRDLNRLELAGETLLTTLEALACAAPDWLAGAVSVREWADRYGPRTHSWHPPASTSKREEMALVYGRDGFALLEAVHAPDAPSRATASNRAPGGPATRSTSVSPATMPMIWTRLPARRRPLEPTDRRRA